jgi:glyoxylase-like metal-dependent hydrolase (beta-lactamase superfamily II)
LVIHQKYWFTLRKKKALFAGDTLRFDGSITRAPEQYIWNSDKEKESIKKISRVDFDVMLPGHGEILQR